MNSNPIRFGSNADNASPLPSDLWLPLFGGELLARYDENIMLKGMVNAKTIASGTTLKFPRSWKMDAERHAAGEEMLGMPLDMSEISISTDDRPIVSHRDLDDIDLKMSHFEIRNQIALEMARAIAREEDKNIAKLLIKTSRTAAPSNGPFPGGGNDQQGGAYVDAALNDDDGVPSSSGSRAAAGALIKALDSAALKFIDRDIPENDRVALVRPGLWMALRVFGIPVSAAEMYGSGATAGPFWHQPGLGDQMPVRGTPQRSMPLEYNGFKIYQTPNLPSTNVTTGETKYQGNYTNTAGVIFQKEAMAYLSLLGLKMETYRDVRRQSDFVVASILGGGGALRPDSAIELAVA